MIYRTILMLLIAGLFGWPADKASAQSAPVPCSVKFGIYAETNPTAVNDGNLHCRCKAGYEFRENTCKLIPTISAKPEPTMRAQTKAECMADKRSDYEKRLKKCEPALSTCLKKPEVRDDILMCGLVATATGLTTAAFIITAIADPTKLGAIATGGAAASAGVGAGDCLIRFGSIQKSCGPDWHNCSDREQKVFANDMKECSSR